MDTREMMETEWRRTARAAGKEVNAQFKFIVRRTEVLGIVDLATAGAIRSMQHSARCAWRAAEYALGFRY